MSQELRKVKFALCFPQGFSPNETEQVEAEDLSRVRNGFFHGETEELYDDLKQCKFVVEDEETGIVHCVDPQLVQFIK